LCGIVGLKPTYGRASLRGVIPLSWSLDHPGPMTRTVEDAAILMEIIAGHDPLDPYTSTIAVPRYTHALTASIKGIRVGVPVNYFFDELTPTVEAIVRTAVHDLEQLGAQILEIEMPDMAVHRATWLQIGTPEAYSYHERRLEEHAELYGADVRGRLEAGRTLLSVDYVRAQRTRALMKTHYQQLFRRVDVIATPTVPMAAPLIADAKTAAPSLTRFTRYFNIIGVPAISIPCGFSGEGLPVGLQIAGKAFDESTVLRVAHAYEQNAKWSQRLRDLCFEKS
jgi:aspartyl-tRNA(Asn)/glutamyl-tRNA(Gln) amidotransferase subunit A